TVGTRPSPRSNTGLNDGSELLSKTTNTAPVSQRQMVLAFLGLVAGPLLALVCAGMGLYLVLTGKTIAGVIFILVLTQIFIGVGLWAYNARKKHALAQNVE
ncbi:MAG: NF038396 family protein, partial [Yaniella sp.]|nr:NF038396 family protein [Yaniella sp.]